MTETNSSDDFQLVDASCFQPTCDSTGGTLVQLSLPCPVCRSYSNQFVCSKCLNRGSFSSIHTTSQLSYSELSKLSERQKNDILVIGKRIDQKVSSPDNNTTAFMERKRSLETLASSLETALEEIKSTLVAKKKKVANCQKMIARQNSMLLGLEKRNREIAKHFDTIAERRSLLLGEFNRKTDYIRRVHSFMLRELFETYFFTELSVDRKTPDRFVNVPLHVNKNHLFAGPEPTPSSHTVLSHCATALRAAFNLLDIPLPPTLANQLRPGSNPALTSSLPQRDCLSQLHSAVVHGVHLLCCRLGLETETSTSNTGKYHCLSGLYRLARFYRLSVVDRPFDSPYCLELNGTFGQVGEPRRTRLASSFDRIQEFCVEEGEEVDEGDDQEAVATSSTSTTSTMRPPTPPPTTSRDQQMDDDRSDSNCWEVIGPSTSCQLAVAIESPSKQTAINRLTLTSNYSSRDFWRYMQTALASSKLFTTTGRDE